MVNDEGYTVGTRIREVYVMELIRSCWGVHYDEGQISTPVTSSVSYLTGFCFTGSSS